jgi:4'-phosphopantetheinyl transferase
MVPGAAVEVWTSRLDGLPIDVCRASLTIEELERARRFSSTLDAERFVKRRAVRRVLLGRLTGLGAIDLHLATQVNGKPYLVEAPGVAFSASHSEGVMLLAFSNGGPVGIDVERIVCEAVDASISSVAFSGDESDLLYSLPAPARCRTFYRWWVRKEAIAKGSGEGLGPGMPAIAMPLREVTGMETLAVGDWWTSDLEIEQGYAAAVATKVGPPAVTLKTFGATQLADA